MKTANIIVSAIVLVALIVLCFFIQCNKDLYFLIAGFVVLALGSVLAFVQDRKLNA